MGDFQGSLNLPRKSRMFAMFEELEMSMLRAQSTKVIIYIMQTLTNNSQF